jgi:hypothetical protein
VAFSRLRQWSTQADVSADVRLVVNELASDPAMTSWLRNYQLNGNRRASPDVSS